MCAREVVWGKHQSTLDMRTVGSKVLQWQRRTIAILSHAMSVFLSSRAFAVQERASAAMAQTDPGGPSMFVLWAFLPFRCELLSGLTGWCYAAALFALVFCAVGVQGAGLGDLCYHNKYLRFVPKAMQNKSLWDKVFGSAEAAVRTDSSCLVPICALRHGLPHFGSERNSDLMQLVAEIASYEDFVDEGNYNVDSRARSLRAFMGVMGPRLEAETLLSVTVGTTSFDDLVKEVDSESFQEQAKSLGYKSLVVQSGRGTYRLSQRDPPILEVKSFDLKPSLEEEMSSASLVISHAGAGSIIEALRQKRRLLVVVNPCLMDNHQLEVAEAMAAEPKQLRSALAEAAKMEMQPYPPADLRPWHKLLEEATGVSPTA
eukprot:Skav207516  [mRNA]  locus=scaffold907:206762:211355:+ [translate_table: standard]